MSDSRATVERSILALERWVESHDYKGYEPFDGLSSYLRSLTRRSAFCDRLLLQLIRQSPINLRPLLGVRPLESTKGRGYMAAGYLAMLTITGSPQYEEKARRCLDWLIEHKSQKFREYTWGNHFDFVSRGGGYSKDEPIIVWTALIGQAFLDAYEHFGDDRYLQVAVSACDWILALPREQTSSGTCISYHALYQSSIHNANMLGAALLARTAKFTKNAAAVSVAKAAMEYSCARQRDDGAWYYGEDPRYHWIDNFHTGYNLDSLKTYVESTGDRSYDKHLRVGFEFFVSNFFEENGRPKYYHNRTYPVDSQCISQAIETLATFSQDDPRALALSVKVAQWAIDQMQDRSGYFYYRQYPLMKAKTPMLHWAQATTYKALTSLLLKIK
jgi:rhamnogalacturonyl hydrolase YesR